MLGMSLDLLDVAAPPNLIKYTVQSQCNDDPRCPFNKTKKKMAETACMYCAVHDI